MKAVATAVLLIALTPGALRAATLRVPDDHPTIQEALDAAADGDTVLVAPGEYVITEPLSFNRRRGLFVVVKDLTLRSEAGAEETVIRMAVELEDAGEASVIVFERGETGRSSVEGFTITGGRGRTVNDTSTTIGGGILCLASSPRISRCRIVGNSVAGSGEGLGGGVYCEGRSDMVLEDCVIADNRASQGGGVSCLSGDPVVEGCVISGNAATSSGGGVFFSKARFDLLDCRFDGNTGQQGGAVFLQECVGPLIESCLFSGNHSIDAGGGLYSVDSSPRLEDCTFFGNSASRAGGAAYLRGTAPSDSRFVGCTIAGNVSSDVGGLRLAAASTLVSSCILWDNFGGSLSESGSTTVIFSCIDRATPWPGRGNINDDPLFGGWGSRDVVHVDASRPGPGTGSEADPYPDIRAALSYSLALSPVSPCLDAAEGGRDMGASHGVYEGERRIERLIHLAPGRYEVEGVSFAQNVSLEGAGSERTFVVGPIVGLRTDSSLRGVTITGGTRGALMIDLDEAPRITDCTITGNSNSRGGVIHCFEGASPTFERCRITWNSHGLRRPLNFGQRPPPFVTVAVLCDPGSAPTFVDCVISDNRGTGLTAYGARPVLTGCSIVANSAAGVDLYESNAELRQCVVAGNGGGGLYLRSSSPRLDHCVVAANVGVSAAGGVYAAGSSHPEIVSSILWGNPGGSLLAEDDSQPEVSYSTIESETVWEGEGNINSAPLFCGWGAVSEVHVDRDRDVEGDGSRERPYLELKPAVGFSFAVAAPSPCIGAGADGSDMGVEGEEPPCEGPGQPRRTIHLAPGTYRLSGASFASGMSIVGAGPETTVIEGTVSGLASGAVLSGVTVTGGAGVVVASGTSPRIENVAVTGSSSDGVTCSVNAAPELIDCTISESARHGVTCWLGSAPTLTRCTITRSRGVPGSHGRPYGGGVYCGGLTRVVLVECILADNFVSGLSCGGEVTLRRCRVSGNLHGGVQTGDCRLTMTNCLVVGHSGAFGVENWSPETRITNCTIAENRVGVELNGGTVTSCIVWGNAEGGVRGSGRVEHSIVQSTSWVRPENGNLVEDPLFRAPGQPAPDGFWTPGDYRLQESSPAIDAGTSEGALAVDFGGMPRLCGDAVDIGAYESCGEPPARFRRGDANDDGGVNTSDAVFILLYSFQGGAPPLCLDSADVDDDGAISVTDPVFLLGFLFAGGDVLPAPFEECGGDLTRDELDCQRAEPCE